VQGTQKAVKTLVRFVELGTLFLCPGIHFHEQKLTEFEKKNIKY
jgi:hypothetical protein